MPQHKNPRVFVALFLWATLFSYVWVAPRLYHVGVQGYADFSAFYTAAKIVQRGQGHQLYDLDLQTQVQREFSQAAVVRNRALPYLRLPFDALLFVPLSYLSYERAYEAWALFNLLLVGWTAVLLRSRLPELPSIPWWIYYPAIFSYWPIVYGFPLGQDCALMMFLVALVLIYLREGKDFRSGCFLGLALIKFQIVLPLLFVLFVKKQFRVLAGFSLVGSMLSVLSVRVLGWDGMRAYPSYLWRLNHVPAAAAIFPSMMPSLRGLVQGWMSPMHSSRTLDLVTAALALAVLVWAARQWKIDAPRESKVYMAGISMVLVAALLAGYHAFSYDLSLLIPVILWAINTALHDGALSADARRALVLSSAVLLFPPAYFVLIAIGRLSWMAVALVLLARGLGQAIKAWEPEGREDGKTTGEPAHPAAG